jgi:hypothetical protein
MTSRRFGGLSTALVALALGVLVCFVAAAAGAPGGLPFTLAVIAVWSYLAWRNTREETHNPYWEELRVRRRVREELGVVLHRVEADQALRARVREELRLDYERKVPAKRMRRYFSLPLFDSRSSLGDVMSGRAGEGQALLFDYRGRTVILFPDVGLLEFELHPPRRWDFRGQGVGFDSEELLDEAGRQLMRDFTRSYTVEALEGEEVRRLFSMEKVAFLAGHPGWEVQSYGGHLLLCKGRKKAPLQERPALFREALALASLFHPPLGAEGPWAGRAGPSAGQIQTKPSHLGDSPRPGPGPASDGRFVSSE